MLLPAPRRIRRTGDARPARSLSRYVWRMSGWHQVAFSLLAVVVAGLSLAPLELQRRLVDDAIMGEDAALLWTLAGVYLGVILAHRAAKAALTVGQGWMAESATRYTRQHLAQRICEGGVREAGRDPGETVSILAKEAEKLGGYVGEAPSQAVASVALLAGMLGYMLSVEPMVAAVGLALLVPQVAIVPVVQRKLNALNARAVQETRAFGGEVNACVPPADREGRLYRLYVLKLSVHVWKAVMKGVIGLEAMLAPLGILLWGGLLVIEGETTLGVVVAFANGFDRLREPVRDLLALYRRTALTAVQHCLIAEWLEGKAAPTEGCSSAPVFGRGTRSGPPSETEPDTANATPAE